MSDRLDVDDPEKMLVIMLKEVLERSVPESDPKFGWGSGCVASLATVLTRAFRTRGIQENVLFRSSIFFTPNDGKQPLIRRQAESYRRAAVYTTDTTDIRNSRKEYEEVERNISFSVFELIIPEFQCK